jgi:putative flippase GtrA
VTGPVPYHAAVTTAARWTRFAGVGVVGFLIQITTLGVLTSWAHWRWLPATLVAVELAVLHNFCWHARWTWSDRDGTGMCRFLTFQFANGLTSIGGNAILMALLAGVLGWPSIPANIAAVTLLAVVNFVTADRWVFAEADRRRLGTVLCVACAGMPSSAAAQSPEALAAWQRTVTATESRLERARTFPRPSATETVTAYGESIRVPSGTISDWNGSVFIRGITLDQLLERLQHPGTPPPQEDIVSSRVLARADDWLCVSIRLARRAIVTVTYDTEHEMRFERWTPRVTTARSVATRIEEVGGGDHGFLWRLHSYWRYEETSDGVRVELESLTLSRDVPAIVRPIAAPLMTRIARESVTRTLEALQRLFS